MAISPGSVVVTLLAGRPGIALADIDIGGLQSVREQLPTLQHRRL